MSFTLGSIGLVALRVAPAASTILRTALFGTRLHLIEYPETRVPRTVLLRRTSIYHLKNVIHEQYKLNDDESVKSLALFHVPFFTEPMETNRDVRLCAQNRAWVLWTRADEPIPQHFKPKFGKEPKADSAKEDNEDAEEKPLRVFARLANDPISTLLELPNNKPSEEEFNAVLLQAFPGCKNLHRAVPHKDFSNILVNYTSVAQLQDGIVITLHPKRQRNNCRE